MVEIKSLITSILPYLPFISAAVVVKGKDGIPHLGDMTVIITRLLEAGIIGAVIMYANVQVLESKFETVKSDIEKCNISDRAVRELIKEQSKKISEINVKQEILYERVKNHSLSTKN